MLDTVANYITEARALLQDEDAAAYRYSDEDLKAGLGLALMNARKWRADLFENGTVPSIDRTTSSVTSLTFELQYRNGLLFYMVGHCLLRDEEEGSPGLAAGYINKGMASFLTIAA